MAARRQRAATVNRERLRGSCGVQERCYGELSRGVPRTGCDGADQHRRISRECVLSRRPDTVKVIPPVAAGKSDWTALIRRRENIVAKIAGRPVARSNVDAAGSDVETQRGDIVVVPERGLAPRHEQMGQSPLIIQLAEQSPRGAARSVIIVDHYIDVVAPRTARKSDVIQANRGEGGRITIGRKLIDESHFSNQPGISAVAILKPAIIVDDDARLLITIARGRRRNEKGDSLWFLRLSVAQNRVGANQRGRICRAPFSFSDSFAHRNQGQEDARRAK